MKTRLDCGFDPVGNVTNRLITGLQGVSGTLTTRYQYDVMNRLTNVVQLTNGATSATAGYSYDAAGRLFVKGYGNGDMASHLYDPEGRLLRVGITNFATPVWWSTYGWDAGGNILAITNNGTNVNLYTYDRVSQLTNEVAFTLGQAGTNATAWVYDEAGNWLNPPWEDTRWVYNPDNELVGCTETGDTTWSVTVTGAVEPGPRSNKWYHTWAECRGVWARVSTNDGTFALPAVPLYAGTNELVVTVRDVSGNTSQQTRTVVKECADCLEQFYHDGNGNLTNWVSGAQNWTYQWDWANQLTKVTSNGIAVLENWYDTHSRRIAKKELVAGQTRYTLYVSDGWASAVVLNQAAQVLETHARGVGLAGDIGTLVAVTHHAGSVTNGTFYTHHNHRGDIEITRASTATLGRYQYTAFGSLKSQTGPDVCRFKFSSKERDASTGFSYYGYRFYAPQWQRWLGADPIREQGGMNLYGFTRNNPISAIDSDGRGWLPVIVIGAAALWQGVCAIYAANKAVATFPTDDTKQHCMASCVHNQCTALMTPSLTIIGGILWELRPGGVFDWDDIMADIYGVGVSHNLLQSCKDSCDKCPI